MYKRSDIQERAESILKTETGKRYTNPAGIVGFIISAILLLAVEVIFALKYFKIVSFPPFKENLYIYIVIFGGFFLLMLTGFILCAIGALVGHKVQKNRMVPAKVMLCILGMAFATLSSIFAAITFVIGFCC